MWGWALQVIQRRRGCLGSLVLGAGRPSAAVPGQGERRVLTQSRVQGCTATFVYNPADVKSPGNEAGGKKLKK